MNWIYLDNNATTPLAPGIVDTMRAALERGGNASSAHRFGRQARQALEDARERVAHLLGAFPDEVVFTSGATEANNLALHDPPTPILASPIEHPSVAEPLRWLQQRDLPVRYLSVGRHGRIVVPPASTEVDDEPEHLVCMLVNHETGVVQPVGELRRRFPEATFHCDATQAIGKLAVDFHELGVTTLSLSAHKFHGPQGIGALLVRRGSVSRPLFRGGHQQRGLRPGTEPIALVVGLAAALELASRERETRFAHVQRLRDAFLAHLVTHASPLTVNGEGIPFVVNVSFPGLTGDVLLMALDLAGVACSTGSACSSGSLLPSPTLQAMHVDEADLRAALRFSFSGLTTSEETMEAARRISAVVNRLRHE